MSVKLWIIGYLEFELLLRSILIGINPYSLATPKWVMNLLGL